MDVEAWKLSVINKLCALLKIWDSFYVTLWAMAILQKVPSLLEKKCKTCVYSFVSII